MRAALYKDVIANKTNLVVLCAVLAAVIGLGIHMRQLIIFPFIFGMVGMLHFMSVFARDGESKVNRTILAGPVDRNALVNLNYLITVILGAIAFAVTGIAAHFMATMPWKDSALVASFAFAATLSAIVIQLPLFYKFGPDRAKLFLVAVFVIVFAGSSYIGSNKQALLNWVAKALTLPPLTSAGVLLAVTLALTAVSLWLSRRIFARREF